MAPGRHGKERFPLAFCGFRVCGEKPGPGKAYCFPAGPGEISVPSEAVLRAFLRGKRYLNASNVLYGRSFLQEHRIRFPRGCRFAEDREFIVKACLHAGTIAVVPEPLVTYVQRPGQSTSLMGNDPNKYAHAAAVLPPPAQGPGRAGRCSPACFVRLIPSKSRTRS